MKKSRIAVAMSGGVDSSVAAYILKEEGHDVFGITMSMIPDYVCKGRERTESILNDARKVAEDLGIEHHVLDLREEFQKEVIDYFSSEYMKGRTPNPCVVCNRKIKFGALFDRARELGADYVVTGHYAKIEEDKESGRFLLKKAEDGRKDQTYFLYNIKKEYLKYILMPLEAYSKNEVREIAKKINLDISEKPDSEEICFIPDEDHGRFIREDLGMDVESGSFVDQDGGYLGDHDGIIDYTIGQRRGLGISLGRRVYVQDIKSDSREVVLGDEDGLFKDKLYAEDINLISIDRIDEPVELKAKIRYAAKEADAIVEAHKSGLMVSFKEAQRAITRGQSVVFYDGDIVVGGGIVKEVY